MDVSSIALSGLNAAQQRVAVSAGNIANAATPGYAPQDLQQTANPGGGVTAEVVARGGDSVVVGGKELPNIAPEEELVNTQLATYSFEANLKVLKTQNELSQSLLDMQA